jgi:hypothetical protein
MMASARADIDLVIGYDLGDDVSYSAFVCGYRHADGTVEIVASEAVPGPISREQLIQLSLASIRKFRPRTVCVRVGSGTPITISNQTVEEVLEGLKEWTDLMIGS